MNLLDMQHVFDMKITFEGDNETDKHEIKIERLADHCNVVREQYQLTYFQLEGLLEGLQEAEKIIKKYLDK